MDQPNEDKSIRCDDPIGSLRAGNWIPCPMVNGDLEWKIDMTSN